MWRVIDMKNLGDLHDMPYDLSIMCRHAVDRCQGQLIDINIEYFGTDELLRYISQRYMYR
ncbi:UNVERIFIED_CONTAM: F-box protein SKIP19 [Sesamum indicum]